MIWSLAVLAMPVYALGHGLGMIHCHYIISRWPEKNGFIRRESQP